MERMIAKDLSVTCSDGSTHDGVTLWLRDGKRAYVTQNGVKLCVETINGGVFLVGPADATIITCNCPMEVD
jgi:hypothetical protein